MKLKFCLLFLLGVTFNGLSTEAPLKIVTEHLPPFQIVKNGQVVGGLSTEIVQALLLQTGESAQIRPYNWARTYKIAKEQENVLIFSLGRDERREKQFKWVGQIYHLENFFWKLATRQDISVKSLEQAKSYLTAVSRENMEHQLLLQKGFVEPTHLVVTATINHAIGMVFRQRADLYLGSKPLIVYMLKGSKYQLSDLAPLYRVHHDNVRLSIAFSHKTENARVAKFQQALQELKRNGTYDRIINKWESIETLD